MKSYKLNAQTREVFGRKVKTLRSQGLLPATVYGKKVKSVSLSVPLLEFEKVYAQAGETGLVELTVGKDLRPVLIHNIQKDPVHKKFLHAEFFQVDLKEKVHTRVPLSFTGEAPAVTQKIGAFLTVMDEVEVEALPTDLPEHIDVDITALAEVDQEIKVSSLHVPSGVTVLSDAGLTVAKIEPLVSKEAEEQAAAEAAAAAAAATEEAGAEAEGGEGEVAPKEEAKPGEKQQEAAPAEAPKEPAKE